MVPVVPHAVTRYSRWLSASSGRAASDTMVIWLSGHCHSLFAASTARFETDGLQPAIDARLERSTTPTNIHRPRLLSRRFVSQRVRRPLTADTLAPPRRILSPAFASSCLRVNLSKPPD